MQFIKKNLILIFSVALLLFLSGCEQDSPLPENKAAEPITETTPTEELENEVAEKQEEGDTPKQTDLTEDKETADETDIDTTDQQSNEHKETDNKKSIKNQAKPDQNKPSEPKQDDKHKEEKEISPAPNPAPAPAPPADTATLTIEGLDGQLIVSETEVPIEQGDSVLDITIRVLKEKGIPYSYTGSGATAYMQGINNLFERDHGPLSGWHFKKNGVIIGRSSDAEAVTKGDKVVWFYTTELTNN